jgi:Carboxypeptidase regulatory-like domain
MRGEVGDPDGAVVGRITVSLRRRRHGKLQEIATTRTNREGKFELDVPKGNYLAVFAGHGFCEVDVHVKVMTNGWNAMRLNLAVDASDTPRGYCRTESTIKEIEKF